MEYIPSQLVNITYSQIGCLCTFDKGHTKKGFFYNMHLMHFDKHIVFSDAYFRCCANNVDLERSLFSYNHNSLVPYAHFRALIHRTFSMLFSERYIPKKSFSRRSLKIHALEHPDPGTFKADMSVKISKNWKFLNII